MKCTLWTETLEILGLKEPNSRFALHGLAPLPNAQVVRYFCLEFTVKVPFSGPSWYLSRQPLLCQPLSSQFALHGLGSFEVWWILHPGGSLNWPGGAEGSKEVLLGRFLRRRFRVENICKHWWKSSFVSANPMFGPSSKIQLFLNLGFGEPRFPWFSLFLWFPWFPRIQRSTPLFVAVWAVSVVVVIPVVFVKRIGLQNLALAKPGFRNTRKMLFWKTGWWLSAKNKTQNSNLKNGLKPLQRLAQDDFGPEPNHSFLLQLVLVLFWNASVVVVWTCDNRRKQKKGLDALLVFLLLMFSLFWCFSFVFLRAGFRQNGFLADFYFWAAGFFRGFSRRIFSPHFCGKKCPEKSSRKIPGKILQNLYNKNPPTHFCRLPRAIT